MHKFWPLCFALLLACGGDDAPEHPSKPDAGGSPDAALPPPAPPDASIPAQAPPLRNPVDLNDAELAFTALQTLGAPQAFGQHSCNDCHTQTFALLKHWRELGDQSLSQCLTDLTVSTPEKARAMIDCLRANPQDASSPFVPSKLGVYTAAAHLDWFRYVFQRAYGSSWEGKYAAFQKRVAMPKGANPPLTQAQFDVVAEWFARGLPEVGKYLPENPPPADCTDHIGPELPAHVTAMKQSGWRALNAEHHLLMHGCSGAANARACLGSYPRAGSKPYGAGWEDLPGAVLRVLYETNYLSAYWTRSSPDGRFVGHGKNEGGAAVIDLAQQRVIPVEAAFDPGFFPDNSGFMFQGPGFLCEQSVLIDATGINEHTTGCSGTGEIGLYQHVGASLDGSDYWVVHGDFASDDGGKDVTTEEPPVFFGDNSTTQLTPMIHAGNAFVPGTTKSTVTPYEGDTVISPSSRLLMSRLAGPNGKQRGYVIRKLVATHDASGGYTVEAPEIARLCTSGAKVNFSFDERWVVTHDYVDDSDAVGLGFSSANDPGFAPYRQKGASNLVLIDLQTGARKRITRMQPGQYALYPHFRSDGWIYFIVRTLGQSGEIVVASDAALVVE
jgi:hypothetical protein